MERKRVW